MTLTDSDLSELLAALKAGEFTDRIRTSLEWILQQIIEAEATTTIGAGPSARQATSTSPVALRGGGTGCPASRRSSRKSGTYAPQLVSPCS